MPDEKQSHHQVIGAVQRQTLTVEEAAQRLGIGRNTAYESIRRGEIPSLRIGRRLVVPVAALERMLAGEGTTDAA